MLGAARIDSIQIGSNCMAKAVLDALARDLLALHAAGHQCLWQPVPTPIRKPRGDGENGVNDCVHLGASSQIRSLRIAIVLTDLEPGDDPTENSIPVRNTLLDTYEAGHCARSKRSDRRDQDEFAPLRWKHCP